MLYAVLIITWILFSSSRISSDAFCLIPTVLPRSSTAAIAAATAASKGFGDATKNNNNNNNNNNKTIKARRGKGSKQSSTTSTKTPTTTTTPLLSKQQIIKSLEKTYGGTTQAEIAKGTESIIERTIRSQPLHIQKAVRLYRQVVQQQQRQLPPQEQSNQESSSSSPSSSSSYRVELDQLLSEYDLCENDIHNLLQQTTWDASAFAKAARALTGEMSIDIKRKVQRGCQVLYEYAIQATMNRRKEQEHEEEDDSLSPPPPPTTTILDVGCGFGVLVPFLKSAGFKSNQIHGIDLSPEMIRHAKETMIHEYLDVETSDDDDDGVGSSSFVVPTFTAGDFLSYQPPSNMKDSYYDGIIFCSSLHDMPNMMEDILPKAKELLSPYGGVLVILHPQGATNVLQQVRSNPTLVRRGLPTKTELQSLDGFELIHPPAMIQSMMETREGYLAILVRKP